MWLCSLSPCGWSFTVCHSSLLSGQWRQVATKTAALWCKVIDWKSGTVLRTIFIILRFTVRVTMETGQWNSPKCSKILWQSWATADLRNRIRSSKLLIHHCWWSFLRILVDWRSIHSTLGRDVGVIQEPQMTEASKFLFDGRFLDVAAYTIIITYYIGHSIKDPKASQNEDLIVSREL